MAAIIPIPTPTSTTPWNQPPSANTEPPWAGIRDTTEAKIRIDIPLPTPRWVMASPSHITNAVPATQVSTISAAFAAVKPGIML